MTHRQPLKSSTERSIMRHQRTTIRQTLRVALVAVLALTLTTQPAWAGRGGLRSSHRNVNVNVNRNINVHRDVDVDVHHSGSYHDGDNHFWGGVAAGVAATLVVGAIVSSPPPASQPVVVNNVTYIVADGTYYQPSGTGYVVVNPPIGVVVTTLPPGAVQAIVNGQVYYQVAGVYYRPGIQNGVTVYTTVRL